MEKDLKNEMLDLLEKPVLAYVKHLMKELGHQVNDEEAANLLGNIGTHRMIKNLRAKPVTDLEENPFE